MQRHRRPRRQHNPLSQPAHRLFHEPPLHFQSNPKELYQSQCQPPARPLPTQPRQSLTTCHFKSYISNLKSQISPSSPTLPRAFPAPLAQFPRPTPCPSTLKFQISNLRSAPSLIALPAHSPP